MTALPPRRLAGQPLDQVVEEDPVLERRALVGHFAARAAEQGHHVLRSLVAPRRDARRGHLLGHLGAGLLGQRVVAAGVGEQHLHPGLAAAQGVVDLAERDQRLLVLDGRVHGAEVRLVAAGELQAVPAHADDHGILVAAEGEQGRQLAADVGGGGQALLVRRPAALRHQHHALVARALQDGTQRFGVVLGVVERRQFGARVFLHPDEQGVTIARGAARAGQEADADEGGDDETAHGADSLARCLPGILVRFETCTFLKVTEFRTL